MGEPMKHESISWLQLERFALDELDPDERAQVSASLASDAEGAAILEGILTDDQALSRLPELPAAAPKDASWTGWWRDLRQRWRLAAGVLATGVAAAAVLVLVPQMTGERTSERTTEQTGEHPGSVVAPGPQATTKGGDVAISLIRERAGVIVHDPGGYRPGDRFKVVITCPVKTPLFGEVVVYQADEVGFPLSLPERLPCGNRRALAGAFAITGESPAEVCLVFDREQRPTRAMLRDRRVALGSERRRAVCAVVNRQ